VTSKRIDPAHPQYPRALLEIAPPPTVWVRGRWPPVPGIAIVGARKASDEGCDFAFELAASLCGYGLAVFSGGAFGIDAAAHRGALSARGVTGLVHAGGQLHPSPRAHADLFEDVVRGGGTVIARMPDDEPAERPHHFLQRNAVLVALSLAVVVVEAGERSGARAAAAKARKMGRPLGIVPGAPWSPTGMGCALELTQGATAVATVDDVLALVGLSGKVAGAAAQLELGMAAATPAMTPVPPGLDDLEARVYGVIGSSPIHIDEIAERTGAPAGQLSVTLLTLALRAVVVEGPSGSYRRAAPRAWRT
jgi:DNA processing protein